MKGVGPRGAKGGGQHYCDTPPSIKVDETRRHLQVDGCVKSQVGDNDITLSDHRALSRPLGRRGEGGGVGVTWLYVAMFRGEDIEKRLLTRGDLIEIKQIKHK